MSRTSAVNPSEKYLRFALVIIAAMIAIPAQAQNYKFKVLHTFHGKDGANPYGQFVWDAHGNLIGTTANGGTGSCNRGPGCGTVFNVNTSGKMLWSYSLKSLGVGFVPNGGLYQDASGNLYGTTLYGGIVPCWEGDSLGCGVLFKLDAARKETVLYRFKGSSNGGNDGYYPQGSPVEDGGSSLYGSTIEGGAGNGGGTVFRVSQAGEEKILYSAPGPPCSPTGGSGPPSPLVLRPGNKHLYGGICGAGTYGLGAAFSMTESGQVALIYSFPGTPTDGLPVTAHGGKLYGIGSGGVSNSGCNYYGCGTVFDLSPEGEAWTEKTLYAFCQLPGCQDGQSPSGITISSDGTIYGTTTEGGNDPNCYNGDSCGVVYKLDATGKETVLHSFSGDDGAFPVGVVLDSEGNLYGAAAQGGDPNCPGSGGHGCGVIFELEPVH
jgi:uncharacterized repeat protein (TIGR03803 family)